MVWFKTWIINNYKKENSPEGDLARDLIHDKQFPNIKSKREGLNYLRDTGACDGAINVFRKCWRKYKRNMIQESV